MTEPTPYELLRGPNPRPGRPRKYDPAGAKARHREQIRRWTKAKRRALKVLASQHVEEYNALFDIERQAIDAQSGPLPGDDEGGRP